MKRYYSWCSFKEVEKIFTENNIPFVSYNNPLGFTITIDYEEMTAHLKFRKYRDSGTNGPFDYMQIVKDGFKVEIVGNDLEIKVEDKSVLFKILNDGEESLITMERLID